MWFFIRNVTIFIILHRANPQTHLKSGEEIGRGSLLLILEECYDLKSSMFETPSDSPVKQTTVRIDCASSLGDQLALSFCSSSSSIQDCEEGISKTLSRFSAVVILISCSNYLNNRNIFRTADNTKLIPYVFSNFSVRCPARYFKHTCFPLFRIESRISMFLISWFVHQGWMNVLILYGRSLLDMHSKTTFQELVKSLVSKNVKVSFMSLSAVNLSMLHGAWKPYRRRELVLLGSSDEVAPKLSLLADELEKEDSSIETCWLIISNTSLEAISSKHLSTGTYYYVTLPHPKPDSEIALEAFRLGVSLVTQNASGCHSRNTSLKVNLPPITVMTKPLNYSDLLQPQIKSHGSNPFSIIDPIPVYVWKPFPEESLGTPYLGSMKTLPMSELYNMRGIRLQVATVSGIPFMRFNMKNNKSEARETQPNRKGTSCVQPQEFFGFLKDILDILSSEMNFTYHLYKVCDGQYGSLENGSWTGIVGELVNGKAHVGLANLGQNLPRSKAVSFPSVFMGTGGAGILIRRPLTSEDKFSVYMMPFSLDLWFCILAFIPVSAILMHIVMKRHRRLPMEKFGLGLTAHSPASFGIPSMKLLSSQPTGGATSKPLKVNQKNSTWFPELNPAELSPLSLYDGKKQLAKKKTQEEDHSMGIFACVWLSLTALMQQGQPSMPKKFSGRLVFITVWICSVVLYAAYTSNLVSFFTITKLYLPVNDLEELVASGMLYGTRRGSVYISDLNSSENPVHQVAYRRLMELQESGKRVVFDTYEEAINAVHNETYALIADYVVLDYYQKTDCDLVLLKEQLFKQASSFALVKNSPLVQSFSYYLTKLHDGGILNELKKKWWRVVACEVEANVNSVAAYKSLGFGEVISAFVILGTGMSLGVLACLCEYSSARVVLLQDVYSSSSESESESESTKNQERTSEDSGKRTEKY